MRLNIISNPDYVSVRGDWHPAALPSIVELTIMMCSDLNFFTTAGSEKCNTSRFKVSQSNCCKNESARRSIACDDVKNVKEEINAALNIRLSRTRICFTKLRV